MSRIENQNIVVQSTPVLHLMGNAVVKVYGLKNTSKCELTWTVLVGQYNS